MLSGKALILATKPYAKEDRAKSWLYTLSTLLFLLLALVGTAWNFHFAARIFCSILSGLLIVRMFVIYHDHQHHAILQKSILADVIMTLFGIFVLAPTSIWKRSHDHHHNHNSKLFSASIGSYPVMTRQKFENSSRRERNIYLATRHPVTIGLGYLSMFIFGMCIASFASSPRRHFDSLIALVLHIIAGIGLWWWGGWSVLALTLFVPFTIACGVGAYLFYAQHNFPGVTFHDNGEWTYEGAALESSSYMKMGPVMNWFTGNIGYHHIHHINSRIPFYRLPEVMKAFPEFQDPRITSLSISDIIKCFRLKLWDPSAQKMISLREVSHTSFARKVA
jgi:acyl-lipid omega-6 desaturase (Delta-12 desaturase)